MLLTHAIDTFLKLERALNTTRSYENLLRFHLLAAFGESRRLAEITYADLVDFTHQLRQKLAPSSYQRYLRILKTFFKWGVQAGYIPVSPAAAIPCRKIPRARKSRAIPFSVLEALLRRLEAAPRDYAITLFLSETACRSIAVANLKISDLDLENHQARVIEKGNESVLVEFGEMTAHALENWLAVRPRVTHDFVFTVSWKRRRGLPMTPGAVTHVIRRASERIAGKAYGAHSIRHWVAEYLVEKRQSTNVVKQKLNHKHLRTTEEYYLPPDDNALVHRATDIVAQRLSSTAHPPLPPNIIELDKVG